MLCDSDTAAHELSWITYDKLRVGHGRPAGVAAAGCKQAMRHRRDALLQYKLAQQACHPASATMALLYQLVGHRQEVVRQRHEAWCAEVRQCLLSRQCA